VTSEWTAAEQCWMICGSSGTSGSPLEAGNTMAAAAETPAKSKQIIYYINGLFFVLWFLDSLTCSLL